MSFRLKKDNVEKVVVSEEYKATLEKEGWKEANNIDLNNLTVENLKALATEKELEFDSKIKKEDLIKLLEDAE